MTETPEKELIQLARKFYPVTPGGEEDERLRAAWRKAMAWKQWDELISELESAFPNLLTADCTQPWMTACRRCCVYLEQSLPDGSSSVTRVAAAASVLAPIYVTYCTTTTVVDGQRQVQLSFTPTEAARSHATRLAQLVERTLGYQPFPLPWATTPVPDIQVGHIHGAQATLLDAFFDNHLENLF